MTRNAEASRERILEAALAEFAAHGIAGARVDRIAAAAGCNKNLIYIYFTDKETLFTTVLRQHLLRVYDEIALTPGDLSGYAMRAFDFAMANPQLMRLMGWFVLEQGGAGPAERSTTMQDKIAALLDAQAQGAIGDAFPPGFLVTAIMSLATAYSAVGLFGPALDGAALDQRAELRARIGAAVGVLAAAKKN